MAEPGCWILHSHLSAPLGGEVQGSLLLHKHIPKIHRPGEVPCPKTPAGLLFQGCWRGRRSEVEQAGHTSGGLRREGASLLIVPGDHPCAPR